MIDVKAVAASRPRRKAGAKRTPPPPLLPSFHLRPRPCSSPSALFGPVLYLKVWIEGIAAKITPDHPVVALGSLALMQATGPKI